MNAANHRNSDDDEREDAAEIQQHDDEREPEETRHEPEQLEHQDLVDVEVCRVAREHELARDLLAIALRREPLRDDATDPRAPE